MHDSPCKTLTDCISEKDETMSLINQRLINIENDLRDIHKMKDDLSTVAEILSAWNNTKGFVTTLKILGRVIMWSAAIGAAFVAFSHATGLGK